VELKRDGFIQYPKNIHEGNGKLFLWYKRALKESGKPPINMVKYSNNMKDNELVSQGFTCLAGSLCKHKFMWVSYISSSSVHSSEIVDINVTHGNLKDDQSASLWLPPCRGYHVIDGNINDHNPKKGYFLWIRSIYMYATSDIQTNQDKSGEISNFMTPTQASARHTSSELHGDADELETQVRRTLRRHCAVDPDGCLNIAKLFQEFDKKNKRYISSQKMQIGLNAFGLKVDAKVYGKS